MTQITGIKLREWRKAQNRTMESLAHELRISYSTLHRWEHGKNKTGISPLGVEALRKTGYQE